MSELAPGLALCDGRYRLERILGAGGMASVWLARDDRLGRLVAVKVISDALAVESGYIERFEREARIAAGLAHPNLVKVFDYGDSSRPFLVMEYVDGGTLADRLRRGDRDLDATALARDLLGALAHIHEAGIVHRDVKPANVLFASDGRAVLTDFGVARPEDATRLTATGNVIGTLRYLPPEVADGGPPTPLGDLYSCGVVLRELDEDSVPDPLRELIGRLTDREPERRPASAREALGALAPASASAGTENAASSAAITTTLLADQAETARLGAEGREIEIRVGPRAAAIAGAIALLVLIVIVAAGGGDGDGSDRRDASSSSTPSPEAPLDEHLDALDRAVRAAGGK